MRIHWYGCENSVANAGVAVGASDWTGNKLKRESSVPLGHRAHGEAEGCLTDKHDVAVL